MKWTIKQLVYTAFFITLGLLLPFLTAQIPQIGQMLLPMHLPVLLCGFLCGAPMGLLAGAITPLLRSILFASPVFYPHAVAMAFELATYGFISGLIYYLLQKRYNKIWTVYFSLLFAMISGRLVWGIIRYGMTFLPNSASFSLQMFLAGAITTAIPGIIIQLILIPIFVLTLQKTDWFARQKSM